MLKRHLPCAVLLTAFCAAATAQDAPPVDVRTLLANLHDLSAKRSEMAKMQFSKVLQDINAAASSNASAIAFYEQAMRATSFAGKNREQTQFQEWKKKQSDDIKSSEMQTAVRLHLCYLSLTLQHANGAKVSQLLPALLNYTSEVTAAYDNIWNERMIKQSVTDGIFAKWYNLGPMLKGLKDWSNVPGDVDAIYQKTILPQMREDKDPRVLQYWDARLQREASAASESKLSFKIDQFNLIDKPSLLWSRDQDLLAIGQRNRAISEMFNLIKSYPNHPANAGWIKSLEAMLTPAPVPASAPATPAAATAAPASRALAPASPAAAVR